MRQYGEPEQWVLFQVPWIDENGVMTGIYTTERERERVSESEYHTEGGVLTQRGTRALVQDQSKDQGRLLPLERGRAH